MAQTQENHAASAAHAAAIVRDIKAGRAAQSEVDDLYKRLRARSYKVAADRGYPLDLVDDAVQDSWLLMVEKIEELRAAGAFFVWFSRIFTSRIVRMFPVLNSQCDVEHIDEAAAAPWCTQRPGDELDPEEERRLDARLAIVRTAVDRLPPCERAVVDLYLIEEQGSREVGLVLGIPDWKVRRVAMAVKQMIKADIKRTEAGGTADLR